MVRLPGAVLCARTPREKRTVGNGGLTYVSSFGFASPRRFPGAKECRNRSLHEAASNGVESR
jgi:hypothetical protein